MIDEGERDKDELGMHSLAQHEPAVPQISR